MWKLGENSKNKIKIRGMGEPGNKIGQQKQEKPVVSEIVILIT